MIKYLWIVIGLLFIIGMIVYTYLAISENYDYCKEHHYDKTIDFVNKFFDRYEVLTIVWVVVTIITFIVSIIVYFMRGGN